MTFSSLFLTSGTYSSTNYTPNHGMVLVGYNYNWGYNVKNSWGINWGNLGYTWVSKYQNGGICDNAVTINTSY